MNFIMKIQRREKIDVLEESDPDNDIAYCKHCLINFNLKHQLGPRLDYNERDADMWRQCIECKRIYPVYAVKWEGKLKGLIEAEGENPFTSPHDSVIGMDNKLSRYDPKAERRKKIREEHDPDVRALLKQGLEIDEDYKWNYQDEV